VGSPKKERRTELPNNNNNNNNNNKSANVEAQKSLILKTALYAPLTVRAE
jgi:hypothetical protein